MNNDNSRIKYLQMLFKLIDEDFYVLENTYAKDNDANLKDLKEYWNQKDLLNVGLVITNNFLTEQIQMIVPSNAQEDPTQTLSEMSVMHLYILVSIVQDILDQLPEVEESETYQKLNMLYSKTKVDFRGIASLIDVAKWNLMDLLDFSKDIEPLTELRTPVKKIKETMSDLITDKNNEHMFSEMYDFMDYLQSFLDSIEGQEFDWSGFQVDIANKILSWVLFIETTLYVVLLVKETFIDEINKTNNLSIKQKTEVTENRKDMITEIAAIKGLKDFED